MDVRYNHGEGDLTIVFSPRDIETFAILMELVFEEEKKRGTYIPNLKKDFFREFTISRKKTSIKFGFEYLELGVIFLEEVYSEIVDKGGDTTVLEQFLDQVVPFCADNSVLH